LKNILNLFLELIKQKNREKIEKWVIIEKMIQESYQSLMHSKKPKVQVWVWVFKFLGYLGLGLGILQISNKVI
jgi:hypothetical protein